MTTHRWIPLALATFIFLPVTGCVSALGTSYRSGAHVGPVRTASYGHSTSSPEYRRIRRDADRYTDLLDHELRLSSRQERDIEHMLIDRARDLLRHTHARYHRTVYPFPRAMRNQTTRRWWDRTDRSIVRMLSPHQRSRYRSLTLSMDREYREYDHDGDRGYPRGY